MPYLSLGVLGLGIDGGEEWAVFSSRVAVGIRDIASWGLSSRPPEPGSGRAPCGLMGGCPLPWGACSPVAVHSCPRRSKALLAALCLIHWRPGDLGRAGTLGPAKDKDIKMVSPILALS